MTKQESQYLKGIAIIMMIYLHLFNQKENLNMVYQHLYIADYSVIELLLNFTHPVPIFLILSGYGLYITWKKGDKNKYTRILKLYVTYIITLVLFRPIGIFINPNHFNIDISNIIGNVTGFKTTWNHEMWFLLPFVLVSLSYPLLCKFVSRFDWKTTLSLNLIIYLGLAKISSSSLGTVIYDNQLLLTVFYCMQFSCFVILGMISAKTDCFKLIGDKIQGMKSSGRRAAKFICCLLILGIGLFLIRWAVWYAWLLILLFLLLSAPGSIKMVFIFLGKHSMNIWMTHTYFCYYIFKEEIYSLKYPIIILISVLALSLGISYVINFIKSKSNLDLLTVNRPCNN